MDNINNIINRFHYRFYSYKDIISILSLWTWVMIMSFIASGLCLVWHLDIITTNVLIVSKGYKLFISVWFIVIGMLSFFRFYMLRDEVAIKLCKKELGLNSNSYAHLKMVWLKRNLPYKRSEYITLAENIDSALTLRTKYKSLTEHSKKGILEYLMTNDSKNRLLAMFMGLSTFVIALSIAYGSSIESVFEFYKSATNKDLVNLFIVIPIFFFIGVLELKILIISIVRGVELFLDNFNGVNGFSRLRAKVFINELVKHYSFEKPRVRVTHNSN
jgi:hypothetical protein